MRTRLFYAAFVLVLFGRQLPAQTPVTFNKEVVRIFQDHCQSCHRPGNIGPFSLLTYQDSRRHALEIRTAVESKEMPPWKPKNPHGTFLDERYLTDTEIQTIGKWVDDGILEGDPADLPPPINFPEAWTKATPDLVLQNSEPYEIPDGDDIYRCFSIPLNAASDIYISGYEILPGNRSIVHHVILFTDSTGESAALDEKDPGPGYSCFGGAGFSNGLGGFGGWAPGMGVQTFPEGAGVKLEGSARVVIQVHYSRHTVGTGPVDPDLTQVGLYLSPTPLQPVIILPVTNLRFVIPPGASNYQVTALMPIVSPVDLVAIAPHMHLLGKDMTVEAWLPFLQRKQLIRIDDWDFHWQGVYNYQKPIRLPIGTILTLTAHFDNSVNNPENPSNPPIAVRFGERTVDEMCFAFVLLKPVGAMDKSQTSEGPDHTTPDQQ